MNHLLFEKMKAKKPIELCLPADGGRESRQDKYQAVETVEIPCHCDPVPGQVVLFYVFLFETKQVVYTANSLEAS